jgi:hypothetical protein
MLSVNVPDRNEAPSHAKKWGWMLAPLILTSAFDEVEWSALWPGRFTSGERLPATFEYETWWGSDCLPALLSKVVLCPP